MSAMSTKEDLKVCINFSKERKRLKISQKKVADFLGMSTKQIGRWESNVAIPADKLDLVQSLGFDVLFIITGERNYSEDFDFVIQQQAIAMVATYIQKSAQPLLHPELFYPIAMEVYRAIKDANDNKQTLDPIDVGAKVIRLFI